MSFVALGCGPTWFLRGAKEHAATDVFNAEATFRAPGCTVLASGANVPGSETVYHFASRSGAPQLLELYEDGRGSVLQNYWADDEGHHFAAYVSDGQAYHYVLSKDLKSGERFVYDEYLVESLSLRQFRLKGEPAARCEMKPGPAEQERAAEPVAEQESTRAEQAEAEKAHEEADSDETESEGAASQEDEETRSEEPEPEDPDAEPEAPEGEGDREGDRSEAEGEPREAEEAP